MAGVVGSQRVPLDDTSSGVIVDGATRAPFEEHQVIIKQMHWHRHDVLLAGCRVAAAVDEALRFPLHALQFCLVFLSRGVPRWEAKGSHGELDQGQIGHPFHSRRAAVQVSRLCQVIFNSLNYS